MIFRPRLSPTTDLLPASEATSDWEQHHFSNPTQRCPSSLNPSFLVDILLERDITAPVKLDHLILTLHDDSPSAYIPPQNCIPQFKAFTSLSHLEIDDRLLLPLPETTTSNGQTKFKLKSLVDYLPPSIIYIRLHVRRPFSDPLELLGDIAAKRDQVPNLRLIEVRDVEMVHDRQALYQIQQELRYVGVKMVVEMVSSDYSISGAEKAVRMERRDGNTGVDVEFFGL
jgi:hypothetical protein